MLEKDKMKLEGILLDQGKVIPHVLKANTEFQIYLKQEWEHQPQSAALTFVTPERAEQGDKSLLRIHRYDFCPLSSH